MHVGFCPECKVRFQVNPGSKPLNCPHCKTPLFVEYIPDRREAKSEAPVPAAPAPASEPLSLDDAEVLPNEPGKVDARDSAEPKDKPATVPIALVAGGIAFALLLAAGGAAAAWFAFRDKPEEAVETAGVSTPAPEEERKPEEKPRPPEHIDPPMPTPEEVTPQTLVARAKSGEPKLRVQAVNQLALMAKAARPVVPDLIPLLDDMDENVRSAAGKALEKIGPPAAADAACISKALAGTGRAAKLYALRHYARSETATLEQLPLLVKCLDDSELAVREQALAALERFGPGCKAVAFSALFAHTVDSNPAFAARTTKLLLSLAPYDGAERRFLVASLRNPSESLRLRAVSLLAPVAPDESTACEWFEGLMQDKSGPVRAAALTGLTRWPGTMKRLESVFISCIRDQEPAVRESAIRAIGKLGTGPEVKQILLDAAGPKATAEDRTLATELLLERDFADPKLDPPILAELLRMNDDKVRAKAFSKAAALKGEAKVFLPQIGDALKQPNGGVRVEAMKLASVVGGDAASLAPAIAEFLLKAETTKPGTAAQLQAADTLARLGPAGTALLIEAVTASLPDEVFTRVCDSLGRKGAEVPAKLIPQLFVFAEKSNALRTAMGDLLGRVGGDESAKLCAERTFWSFKTLGTGKKIKECKYPLEVQVWAIQTMGKMDPKSMTEKGRGILIERMKSLSKTNPDEECRKSAEAAHAKLIAAGLGDKP